MTPLLAPPWAAQPAGAAGPLQAEEQAQGVVVVVGKGGAGSAGVGSAG